MQNLLNDLERALEKDENLVIDGQLNKALIEQKALSLDKDFIKLILDSDSLKKHFFEDIDGTLVFDKVKFQQFIHNKSFLPDSYTAFKNKIGLTSNGNYLSKNNEVVLAWPHKDCVLEGGQDKEDAKRDEIFWNETLAPDDIDRLLAPKVFTNWKKYDKEGEHEVEEPSLNNNYLIKGNNLLALHSLADVYRGKVKLIYIDPPYNTGKDGFNYNDNFSHSTWLTFVENRIAIAKELLRDDGVIFVQITDEEQAYLKIILDEVFQRENFIETIIWKKRNGPPNDKNIGSVHEYILMYAKKESAIKLYLKPRNEEQLSRYTNPDNHPKGPWTSGDLMANVKGGRYVESLHYPIINPNTNEEHYPSSEGNWRFNKEDMQELIDNDEIYWGSDGTGRPKLKRFLSDVRSGVSFSTLWDEGFYSHTGTNQLRKLFGKTVFDTTKPEELIRNILQLGSDENDLIMDFFLGSGTTAAVAHKMGRRYIGIEQMEYVEDVTKKRLQKVIEGEQGGISEEVEWEGGGSFIYAELKKTNQQWVENIRDAKDEKALSAIWEMMKEKAFISYKVNPRDIDENAEEFNQLSLEDQKRFLIEVLDKNLLYVNYSEIDDADFEVSEEDKKLNHTFYNGNHD